MFTNMKYLVLFSQNNQECEEDCFSEKSYDPSEKSFDPGDGSDEEEDLDPEEELDPDWDDDPLNPLEQMSINGE